ncbi:hypothetical protein CL632_00120 [bacterium]|jgi:hypothetical protein|nr:hypothetical protein [bacterium]|tara:strand:+ start:2773 stop:3186 length:414 start_codon:yes stop_codon:yes gene_type:complete
MPRSGGSSIGTVVLIVVILVIGFLWMSQTRISGYNQDWQAVFLTNGQVYFGQVKKQNNVELVVKDIYYLQVTRPLQQTEEGEQQQNPQGELSLVKLGNELHGPTDSMFINRDHVLFVEDLKDDSNVVQAIDNYKTGQ